MVPIISLRSSKLLLALAFVTANGLAVAQPSAPAAGTATDQFTAVMGSAPDKWKVISGAYTPATVNGTPVISSGNTNLVLAGTTDYGPDVEYTLVFHFSQAGGGNGALIFFIGDKEGGKPAPLYLGGSVHSSNDKTVNVYLYEAPPKSGYKVVQAYNVKDITPRSLSWPEALRKSIEQAAAAQPNVTDKWFTLRYVVHKGLVQVYLDDRFVGQRNEPGLDVGGKPYFTLYQHTDIAKFTVKPLPKVDPRYGPVALDGYVNSGEINGQHLQRGALPATDAIKQVGGIPFLFPGADKQGNDHIALARSWAQFSGLEGYFESQDREFGGRWPTAFSGNQARIQLRVPYDSYNNLHLIAASDDAPNSVPIVTAQFYKELSGYPENFAANDVPRLSARASRVATLPVKLANGRTGSLYLITIPLDPGRLSKLAGGESIGLELTKEVQLYRGYPDPCTFSYHQAGRPSSVHIYAATLGRSPVAVDFNPDKFGHVWTAPATPAYTIRLHNNTTAPRTVELMLSTRSHDGASKTLQKQSVTVPTGEMATTAHFSLGDLKKYGYHAVTLAVHDGQGEWRIERSLAYLHPDTRVKGNWSPGQGPCLGYWGWGGAHETPTGLQETALMAEAGAETMLGALGAKWVTQEMRDLAKKHGMATYDAFTAHAAYAVTFTSSPLKEKYDPKNPEATGAALIEELRKLETQPSEVNHPQFITLFPEPGLGPISYGTLPEYYGEPEHQLTPAEQKNYDYYLERFLIAAPAIRKTWPNIKILLPYGDPLFAVPFLRNSPEARQYIDGSALDMPGFERMPESQMHQVVHHRLYQLKHEFDKTKPGYIPYYCVVEGTCADTPPGALTWEEQSDIYTRNFLIYFAYGIYLHPSGPTPFDCANYWGEEHYGCCGLFARLPMANPKPSYVAYATLTRHLNRANFTKWLPTGSLSAYCLQFKNVNDGHLVHSLWTIRGKRTVTLNVPAGAKVLRYDADDNAEEPAVKNGQVTFTLTSSPCYIEGLTADPQITLGAPDNSDQQPAKIGTKLANLGDGTWKISTQPDPIYENNNPLQIDRKVGNLSVVPVAAPKPQGGKALAVQLGTQTKLREVMPWYTTIVPPRPIIIGGKASHLGLWVQGASDWGRVVYSLRDATGQRWLSVGTTDSWNCDDAKTLSYFNFDGWRYLRFELPSNAPYDHYIESGSTWWGHHGGDGIVHLPLTLEKIIVERRTNAMYVNNPQPTKSADVLLGDLNAEYATASDKTDAVVKLSQIKMPVPSGVPDLDNPIADLEAKGAGAPTKITHVDDPPREADGTRGLVYFDLVPDAQGYDIWVSPYQNGSGALKMASGWKEPGQLLTGLHADVDFYLFVVYKDRDGKESKPSAPFKIRLKDMFAMK